MTSSPPPIAPGSPNGRVVIVGASLAGLRAAETLRAEGFTGQLTLIGDEPYEPYDRPPLSKAVQEGWLSAEHTTLPRRGDSAAEWLLGAKAAALDLPNRQVQLADGRRVPFDRLLIATGTRARPWPDKEQAALDGVFTVRTRDDAARLHARLSAGPNGRWSLVVASPARRWLRSAANSACKSPSPSAARRRWRVPSARQPGALPRLYSASMGWICGDHLVRYFTWMGTPTWLTTSVSLQTFGRCGDLHTNPH